jgi:hypothetical protein
LVTKKLFEEGVLSYFLDNFSSAADIFNDCLLMNPTDKVAQIYSDRCQQELSKMKLG